jgi:hypothetical protein
MHLVGGKSPQGKKARSENGARRPMIVDKSNIHTLRTTKDSILIVLQQNICRSFLLSWLSHPLGTNQQTPSTLLEIMAGLQIISRLWTPIGNEAAQSSPPTPVVHRASIVTST